jgi:hypothetical protein
MFSGTLKNIIVTTLLGCPMLWAGGSVLEGTISLADGAPVTDAHVLAQVSRLKESERQEFHAENGRFRITLDGDFYRVIFTHPGYEPLTINGLDLYSQKEVSLVVVLDRTPKRSEDLGKVLVLWMK